MAKAVSKSSPKKAKGAKKDKKDKKPRAPSAYNQFMKKQLEVVKKSNPNLDHKEAFKVAAQAWAKAPENPKKK